MALGSDLKKQQIKPEELEDLLNGLDKLLDRTKILYEQYFMGIQKVAPMQLHRDIERRVRELTQQQIRNTSLRFRFTTLSQKFGSYNTYWKRTLREIEQGKYVRDLVRVKRKADRMGEELPEELLVKLPKIVQDRIRRDRAKVAERALREESEAAGLDEGAHAGEGGVHEISEADANTMFKEGDLDIDGLFAALTGPAPEGTEAPPIAATDETAEEAPRGPRVTMPMARGLGATRAVGAPSGASFRVPLPGSGGERAEGDASEEPDAVAAVDAVEAEEGARARAEAARASEAAQERREARRRTPPPTPAAAVPGMDDRQCRELYARYLKARQLVGESNDDVTYERLVSSLSKQASTIMNQHGARGVEFHVVVRGDKVVLKAKPLKPGSGE